MKFVCDNCSTQYLIADEKISAKGVKVRCKRCGHVIVLKPEQTGVSADPAGLPTDPSGQPLGTSRRSPEEVGQAFDQLLGGGGPAGGEEEDDQDDGQATEIFRMEDVRRSQRQNDSVNARLDEVFAAGSSTEVKSGAGEAAKGDWYLAIGDEQVGPMKLSEVDARWAAGEIGPRTLAWQTGMAEWKAIREMEGLKHLWGAAKAAEAQPAAAPAEQQPQAERPAAKDPSEELWSPNRHSELASLVEEEMEAAVKVPASSSAKASPGEGFGLPESEEVPPWEREDSVVSGEVARPSESYFDSSLDSKPDEAGGKSNAAYSRSGSVLAGPAYLGGAKRSGSKMKLVAVAAGAGLLVVLAAVGYFALRPGPEPEPGGKIEPVGPPERVGEGNGAAAAPDAGKPAEGGPDKPSEGNPAKPGEGSGGETDVAKPPDGAGEKPGEAEIVVKKPGEVSGPDKPAEVKKPPVGPGTRKPPVAGVQKPKVPGDGGKPKPPPDKPVPPPEPEAGGDLPQKLAQADVGKALQKFVPAMKGCVQQQQQRDPSVTGTMVVTFTIAPSGAVSSFTVSTKEHEGTYVASCISYIIKAIKFPKAREPFTVPKLPLKLGG
ncbi:MAG TPA: GYF domain-containing protein [Myxococcota bacterium]|nr:GYF domain-containing protein [Myxococcota bacterium]HRY96281.1 GYF domain-containing protein [Myxococcota bacterium]